MDCKGIVMYKGIEKRDGGVFKNDKGQDVNYDSSYVVKFDEIVENKINERKLKFPVSNKVLYNKFESLRPYTQVEIICDVVLMQNACRLVPIDVNKYVPDDSDDEEEEE